MALTSNYYWQEQEHKAPCSCDCPDCEEWVNKDGDVTYPILAEDNGNCYSRGKNNIVLNMPTVVSISDLPSWCITVRNTALPSGDVYVRPAPEDVTTHFYFGDLGVPYDYITIDIGGRACICFDGLNFNVVGEATGWGGT